MKKSSPVLLEKKELQPRGNCFLIALLGNPSIWGSQNDMFQNKEFRSNIAISDRGQTRAMKKIMLTNWKKKEFFYNFTYFFWPIYRRFTFFGFFAESKTFCQIFETLFKKADFLHLSAKMDKFRKKIPIIEKPYIFLRKNPVCFWC